MPNRNRSSAIRVLVDPRGYATAHFFASREEGSFNVVDAKLDDAVRQLNHHVEDHKPRSVSRIELEVQRQMTGAQAITLTSEFQKLYRRVFSKT
jgi:hypothetical protein